MDENGRVSARESGKTANRGAEGGQVSAAQRPSPEDDVSSFAELAVHEDELTRRPTHRLDRLLLDVLVVVEHGHVRYYVASGPTPAAGSEP